MFKFVQEYSQSANQPWTGRKHKALVLFFISFQHGSGLSAIMVVFVQDARYPPPTTPL